MQQKQTVGVFLDFPVVGEDGRINRIYPKANFSELISQVYRCEPGHLKMVGVIMVVDALITRIKEAGLGVASYMKDPSTKDKAPNGTGELSQFDDRLRKFRCDRNLVVHNFLWRNTDGISEEIMDRSCKLMDDLLHHFIEVRPDPETPGVITLRFPISGISRRTLPAMAAPPRRTVADIRVHSVRVRFPHCPST